MQTTLLRYKLIKYKYYIVNYLIQKSIHKAAVKFGYERNHLENGFSCYQDLQKYQSIMKPNSTKIKRLIQLVYIKFESSIKN